MDGVQRVGVVGVGALGRHHARVVQQLAGLSLAGVFDTDAERAATVAERLGAAAMPSLESLLDASDAVVVAVPTRDHEAVATDAARAGVHVFVEKPLAPDLEAADRIVAAAREHGVTLQVGHVERFNSVLAAAAPYLDRPLFLESHRLAPFAPRSLDVAVVLDLMIHDVDLACSLVGEPATDVAAAGVSVLSPYPDVANARIEFRGGAVANLTASRVSMRKVRKLRVWQRSGYLSLDLADGRGEFFRLKGGASALDGPFPGGAPSLDRPTHPGEAPSLDGLSSIVERIPLQGAGPEPLAAELGSFRDAVAGLAPPPVTGEDGRRALHLALAIEKRIEDHVAHTRSASPQARVDRR